jgi:hypothetical protein
MILTQRQYEMNATVGSLRYHKPSSLKFRQYVVVTTYMITTVRPLALNWIVFNHILQPAKIKVIFHVIRN